MWEVDPTLPNMYCEQCLPIRKAARNMIAHIVDTLYLSDMQAAGSFDGYRLCVHENGPLYTGQCHFHPILVTKPNSPFDRSGALASIEALDAAAEVIHEKITNKENIVVHCMGGIERSPLTIAWYLVTKSKMFDTLQEAYDFLKTKRPVVSERLFWLPGNFEEYLNK